MSRILLDTNELSELMRRQPAAEVLTWFEQRQEAQFWISTITTAEIYLVIALLPAGQRRDTLALAAQQMFTEDFAGRCLPFNERTAAEYALLVASRQRQGRPISTENAQIAAIALSHRLPLASRNVRDFDGVPGLQVVNPWAG